MSAQSSRAINPDERNPYEEIMSMHKTPKLAFVLLAVVAACAVLCGTTTRAEDFENQKPGAPKWKVVDYNRVQTHPARVPTKIPGGIAFEFLNTPDTALLATSHPSYNGTLLGDLTGKSVFANVGVSVSPDTVFTYYGEGTPSNPCGRPANVRLYFQTDTGGKFEETDYWWSNPVSVDLDTLKGMGNNGQFPLSAPLDPSQWSDYNGHFGSDPNYTAAFNSAVADVQLIGVSFGGGCFFENGVGVSQGGGTFRLMDFNATP